MASDEVLIADLSAMLRSAISFIRSETETFSEQDAADLVRAASARLATIQPKRSAGITLRFTPDRAAILSEGMSDLLCWCAGFSAAIGPEVDRHPYGVEAVRLVREELRAASLAARGLQDEELPF